MKPREASDNLPVLTELNARLPLDFLQRPWRAILLRVLHRNDKRICRVTHHVMRTFYPKNLPPFCFETPDNLSRSHLYNFKGVELYVNTIRRVIRRTGISNEPAASRRGRRSVSPLTSTNV